MSDRIDHAAKALKALDNAQGFYWEDDPAQVTLRLLHAQAEATLALVEQQRIANLLAFGSRGTASGEVALHDAGVALGIYAEVSP